MRKYAGIGSRATPHDACMLMTRTAVALEARGWLLRSGGAEGADRAFAHGTTHKEIFRANDATAEAFDHAAKYHPAWERCSAFAQALHARNSMILLGRNLDDPVDMVVCWTLGEGGTMQGVRIAEAYKIPVFNLVKPDALERLREFVGG